MVYILISILIIAFDQITKILTAENFSLGQVKEIIPHVLSFTFVKNEGAAFGILQGARVFFIILTIIYLRLIKKRCKGNKVPLFCVPLSSLF